MSSYIDNAGVPRGRGGVALQDPHGWSPFTDARLRWLYGDDYATKRATTTAADIALWNRLGTRKAAA